MRAMTGRVEFEAVNSRPEVASASQRLVGVAERLNGVRERLRGIRAEIDPTVERRTSDPRTRRRAMLDEAEVQREELELEIELEEATARATAARERAVDEVAAKFGEADRADRVALAVALETAAKIERRRSERRAAFEAATGRQPSFDSAWPELSDDPNSRLTTWRALYASAD